MPANAAWTRCGQLGSTHPKAFQGLRSMAGGICRSPEVYTLQYVAKLMQAHGKMRLRNPVRRVPAARGRGRPATQGVGRPRDERIDREVVSAVLDALREGGYRAVTID